MPHATRCVQAHRWTDELSHHLQQTCDEIFLQNGGKLSRLHFSVTVADPHLEGSPLVGCSIGFSELCGYTMDEIVGRNCRFLVDQVPPHLLNEKHRKRARDFCEAVREGREYQMPPEDVDPWMPASPHSDNGVFCVQMNARKDGSLFRNMFYMKVVRLSDREFIVALQSELSDESVVNSLREARQSLDTNMGEVERVLSSIFWLSCGMRRQDEVDPDDGFCPMVDDHCSRGLVAPDDFFDPPGVFPMGTDADVDLIVSATPSATPSSTSETRSGRTTSKRSLGRRFRDFFH